MSKISYWSMIGESPYGSNSPTAGPLHKYIRKKQIARLIGNQQYDRAIELSKKLTKNCFDFQPPFKYIDLPQ